MGAVDPAKNRAKSKRHYDRNRESILQRKRVRRQQWTVERHEHELIRIRAYRLALKLEAYDAYGGVRCACCDEAEELFLSLDHVDNNGGELRRHSRREQGTSLYKRLRDDGYPPGYQVLCMNCNHGKSRNEGVCPHKGPR